MSVIIRRIYYKDVEKYFQTIWAQLQQGVINYSQNLHLFLTRAAVLFPELKEIFYVLLQFALRSLKTDIGTQFHKF